MSETLRTENGHFAPGTAPGPGRPRRAIEADYLRVVADAVSLDTWRAIVDKAVTDAKAGDSRAREFIASRLIGTNPLPLMSLAIREVINLSTDEEITAGRDLLALHASDGFLRSFQTPLDHAIEKRIEASKAAKAREHEAAKELEREQIRIKRAARKAQRDRDNERGASTGHDEPAAGNAE